MTVQVSEKFDKASKVNWECLTSKDSEKLTAFRQNNGLLIK